MDGLKKINDTYGHEVGDAAIKAMALILNDVKPDSSFFCLRYGGDEFLLMGSCDNEDEAANIQKQIEKDRCLQQLRHASCCIIGEYRAYHFVT